MIGMEKRGGELASTLAEIKRLRGCEAVRTAQKMAQVGAILDGELRQLKRLEREGQMLIEQGFCIADLDEILRAFDGGGNDA